MGSLNDSDDNDDTVQLETGSGLPAGTTWNTQGASWLPTWDYDHDDDDDDGDQDDVDVDHDTDDDDDDKDNAHIAGPPPQL